MPLWFLILLIELPVSPMQTGLAPEPIVVALEPADRNVYLLGAGDILTIAVEGGTSLAAATSGLIPLSLCTVGSDGVISVSGLGQIAVSGLTIIEAESDLALLARRYFPGMQVGLSLYQPRLVRVRASGMVQRPDVYPLYALQRVSDLLDLCGGLVFPASHRGWMYFGADSVRIDLLPDIYTHQPVSDPLVVDGAVVVMEACESPVFVMRPSLLISTSMPPAASLQAWDVGDGMPLRSLLEVIGGAGANVDYTRSVLRRGGEARPLWAGEGIAEIEIHSGDTLVLAGLADSVAISGAVGSPAPVAWSPGLTSMDYIALAGGTIPGSDLRHASIYRGGVVVVDGHDALSAQPAPGDAVDVPYSWISRNIDMVTFVSTLVSMAALIYSISKP
jgi:protein involved in polysaccharide export with SLBB domain